MGDGDDGPEEINYEDISLINHVGRGAFGVVWRAKWKGKDVAVKYVEAESEIAMFRREVDHLARAKHPNIVPIYGACMKVPVCLVMEFAECGSLFALLHYAEQVDYTFGHALSWLLQCARGVEYLHSMKPRPVVHRDLKPPNLLLKDHCRKLLLCDFGTAVDAKTYMTNNKGSAAWMAPEVFEGVHYSEKCDVFSFGIIIWEVLSRHKPFHNVGGPALRILWLVHQGNRPPLLENCPKLLEQLMTQCWRKAADERPSMAQAVKVLEFMIQYVTDYDVPIPWPKPYSPATGTPLPAVRTGTPDVQQREQQRQVLMQQAPQHQQTHPETGRQPDYSLTTTGSLYTPNLTDTQSSSTLSDSLTATLSPTNSTLSATSAGALPHIDDKTSYDTTPVLPSNSKRVTVSDVSTIPSYAVAKSNSDIAAHAGQEPETSLARMPSPEQSSLAERSVTPTPDAAVGNAAARDLSRLNLSAVELTPIVSATDTIPNVYETISSSLGVTPDQTEVVATVSDDISDEAEQPTTPAQHQRVSARQAPAFSSNNLSIQPAHGRHSQQQQAQPQRRHAGKFYIELPRRSPADLQQQHSSNLSLMSPDHQKQQQPLRYQYGPSHGHPSPQQSSGNNVSPDGLRQHVEWQIPEPPLMHAPHVVPSAPQDRIVFHRGPVSPMYQSQQSLTDSNNANYHQQLQQQQSAPVRRSDSDKRHRTQLTLHVEDPVEDGENGNKRNMPNHDEEMGDQIGELRVGGVTPLLTTTHYFGTPSPNLQYRQQFYASQPDLSRAYYADQHQQQQPVQHFGISTTPSSSGDGNASPQPQQQQQVRYVFAAPPHVYASQQQLFDNNNFRYARPPPPTVLYSPYSTSAGGAGYVPPAPPPPQVAPSGFTLRLPSGVRLCFNVGGNGQQQQRNEVMMPQSPASSSQYANYRGSPSFSSGQRTVRPNSLYIQSHQQQHDHPAAARSPSLRVIHSFVPSHQQQNQQ